jgi:CDP-diglyceride synthetase
VPQLTHQGNVFAAAAVVLGAGHLIVYAGWQLLWNVTGRSGGPDEIAFGPPVWLLAGAIIGPVAIILALIGRLAVRRGWANNPRLTWVGLAAGIAATTPAAAIFVFQILPGLNGTPTHAIIPGS